MPSVWSKAQGGWQQRIARAEELAGRHAASREVLNFYRSVLQFQSTVGGGRGRPDQDASPNIRSALDLRRAAAQLPGLIAMVREHGPAHLAAELQNWRQFPDEQLHTVLSDWLAGKDDGHAAVAFIARVLLEPQAEALAGSTAWPPPTEVGKRCPACGSVPQLAVLRPEGDGGKRMLLCSLCHAEWEFRRVLCPACSEQNHEKLPRYTADDFPSVRVEACDTCKHYLKSVDLTVDGHAVPLVDEVAAAPLDLWAAERGYQKLVPNIMGF